MVLSNIEHRFRCLRLEVRAALADVERRWRIPVRHGFGTAFHDVLRHPLRMKY